MKLQVAGPQEWGIRNSCKIFVGKSAGKWPILITGNVLEANFNMDNSE